MQRALYFLKCILKPFMVLSALIITWLVILSGLIFVPASWLPFFLYRVLVISFAKFKIPDGSILKKTDCSLALGKEYTSTTGYITWQCTLDGKLSLENAINDWTELVVNKLDEDGELKFPRLRERFEIFGGYVFTRKVANFEAKNYIYVHQDDTKEKQIIDKLKILEIRKKFHDKLFRNNGPLWEILIVNNYRDDNSAPDLERSVFIFKFSHVLCDGVAGMDLLYRHLGGCTANNPNMFEISRKLKFFAFLQQLSAPFLLIKYTFRNVYDFLYNPSRVWDINPWHEPKLSAKGNKILWVLEPINKKIFREIKSELKVSVMSILLAVISGGIRRMMIAKNLNIPEKMRIMFPVPLPNHPEGLTNHVSMAIFRIPISSKDCKETIKSNDRLIKKAVPGPTQLLMSFIIFYTEVFPVILKGRFAYTPFETINISCLRLPTTEIKFFGLKAIAQNYALSFSQTNSACLVAIFGFDDEFHISLQVENSLLSHPDEIQDLEKYILEELDFLGKNVV